jgi:hypothetical protein
MKFFDYDPFTTFNSLFYQVFNGDAYVSLRTELYSTKQDKEEKALAHSLDDSLSASLDDSLDRKSFIRCVQALNVVFPDFDFAELDPSSMIRLDSTRGAVCSLLESVVPEAGKQVGSASPTVFQPVASADYLGALGEAIPLNDAEAFAFEPDPASNPLEHAIFSSVLLLHAPTVHRMVVLVLEATVRRDGQQGAQDVNADDDRPSMADDDDPMQFEMET